MNNGSIVKIVDNRLKVIELSFISVSGTLCLEHFPLFLDTARSKRSASVSGAYGLEINLCILAMAGSTQPRYWTQSILHIYSYNISCGATIYRFH